MGNCTSLGFVTPSPWFGATGDISTLPLASADEKREIVHCRKKKVLFSQGEPADAIFYVQKGCVKLTVVSEHGKEAVIGILGTGDFFGEGCLAGQPLRRSTATALAERSEERTSELQSLRHLVCRLLLVKSGIVE